MPAPDTASHGPVHALYIQHHGWLFEWLRRKLGCGHQAADVAQDTFLRVLVASTFPASVREPRAYLVTTAKHLLMDEARRKRLEAAYLEALAVGGMHDRAPSAEEIAQTVQALLGIESALRNLPTKARQAFMLHHFEGLGYSAIALELGVSVRMVQKYMTQALVCCHLAVDG